jgi:glycosyltransferase involved in cell wall biosynthesis
MAVDTSVVICAHDARRWANLGQAVASVVRQSRAPREVVVVIDHNAELLERARRELDSATVVENRESRGLGGARNSGVAAASGEIVAFLDDDAVASEDWLQTLAAGYDDPAVAGVGGSIEPIWESGRPAWFPEEFDWVVGCTFTGMPRQRGEVRNLIGCNMSFRRELLEALGCFRLGYGCDETEFCIRLRQRWPEKSLVYAPEARVFHSVPAERVSFRNFLSRCYFEGGSKAVVTRLAGRQDALASERTYTRETLPAGLAQALADFCAGDRSGIARAGAISGGLAATTAGYLTGLLMVQRSARRRGWSGSDIR